MQYNKINHIVKKKTVKKKAKKDIIVCLDGDAFTDAKNIYDKLNGGSLYDRVKLMKLPKDKDVCDLRGQINEYMVQEKEWIF